MLLLHYFCREYNEVAMRVIFMGTPEFAVPSLEKLIEKEVNVVAVITATDKYGGRGGKQLIESAVKICAEKHNIPILQPKNLKSPEFVEELRSYKADVQFVVAFRMLPEVVWNMPEHGTYNLHGSLLPKYRGAAPIHWSVIRGDEQTGVTTFKLKHKIDTGDILLQASTPITEEDSTGTVYERLMHLGADLLYKTYETIASGDPISFIEQDNTLVTSAPKIHTETCQINFDATSRDVFNFIRGMNPFPGAYTFIEGKKLIVYWADYVIEEHYLNPGKIVTDNKKELKIATTDGYLILKDIKLQGKRRMSIGDLLNGIDIRDEFIEVKEFDAK